MDMKTLKTVWLSDIHLGCKDSKAEYLLDFLEQHSIETLYLVGDIIDMWAMSKQFRWPEAHNKVMHKIWQISQGQTRVIYLPGNHDQPLQKYHGMEFGHITVTRETIHTTQNNKKLLVLHGDQFDQEVCFGPIHAWIGDKAYDLLLFINRWYNRVQTWRGKPYWSLAGHIKQHIKGANKAIERYKAACRERAQSLNLDGVVCGHIHNPEICNNHDVTYYNDGDWIENCSALVEDEKGDIALYYWTQVNTPSKVVSINSTPENSKPQAA